MKVKLITLFSLLTLLLVSFTGCDSKKETDMVTPKKGVINTTVLIDTITGKKIPLKVVSAKEVIFEDFKGDKAVLVNFFATWCPPCKAEIPHLVNLQTKYKDDFVVISVLLEEGKDPEEIRSFINYYDINYIVTNSPENFDFEKLMGGVSSIPYMAMYDKEGKFVMDYKGAVPEEMLESDIRKAIGK